MTNCQCCKLKNAKTFLIGLSTQAHSPPTNIRPDDAIFILGSFIVKKENIHFAVGFNF